MDDTGFPFLHKDLKIFNRIEAKLPLQNDVPTAVIKKNGLIILH